MIKKVSAALAMLCVITSANAVSTSNDMSDEAIAKRLKPIGSVHVAGAAASTASASAGGTRSGEEVYSKACVACHATAGIGAPVKGNAADWGPRKEKGFDSLLTNAINGINAMPPKGTCMDCSDEEIKAAIEFMLQGT